MRRVLKAVAARLATDQLLGPVFDTGPGRYGQPAEPRFPDGRTAKHTIVRPAYDTARYERVSCGRTANVVNLQVVLVSWHPDEVGAAVRRVTQLLDSWSPVPGATGLRAGTVTHGEEKDLDPPVPYDICEYRTEIPGSV